MAERGGKTVYGAVLGIVMLETRFPRVHGDIGNALTWPFPVQYRTASRTSPEQAVLGDAEPLLEAFLSAGRELVASGCDGVATNCGFLVPFQTRLALDLGVPVASSSLMQVPFVERMLPPGQRVGVVTISAATLGAQHFEAAAMAPDTPVAGTDPEGEFATKILFDAAEIDFVRCRDEVVAASVALCNQHPEVGAIVLECTNMVPYARDVRRATGRAVFSIHSYLTWFHAALAPARYELEVDDPRG